ncbi:MAG TPA: tyrosinase family protein [Candidatus Elarobacter sp.]
MLDTSSKTIGRRRFIATAGAASAVAAGHGLFVPKPASALTYVRRDIGTLGVNHPIIKSYRKAIKAMKLLPPTNPLSWTYQGAIHFTTLSPLHPAWNSCQHGTPWFWSWHRMYLCWFERIIRKMSGDPGWALPYWNYTSPSERSLPPMFRITSSDLYTVNRNASINGGSPLPASAVNYAPGFTFVNFNNAQSSIEGTPHGAVHVSIGGWMGSVPTAAQDPIFYLHHSNIDRLWDLWLAQGGGRSDPTGDASWKGQSFTFFNEHGHPVHMTSCEVLRAAQQLHYTYQGEPPQVNDYCKNLTLCCGPNVVLWRRVFPPEPVILTGDVTVTHLQLKEVQPKLMAIAASNNQAAILRLDGVVAETQPGIYWEVYVGSPSGRPDSTSPSYIGNVALFGSGIQDEAHGTFMPAHFVFPLNGVLRAAGQANVADLVMTFVPRSTEGQGQPLQTKPRSPVRIGRASILVEEQKAQPR